MDVRDRDARGGGGGRIVAMNFDALSLTDALTHTSLPTSSPLMCSGPAGVARARTAVPRDSDVAMHPCTTPDAVRVRQDAMWQGSARLGSCPPSVIAGFRLGQNRIWTWRGAAHRVLVAAPAKARSRASDGCSSSRAAAADGVRSLLSSAATPSRTTTWSGNHAPGGS